MLLRILETALQECKLKQGQTILVGVSGGPDSLCLLDALHRLDFQTIAAYYNHRLRAEAVAEQHKVEQLAGRMGIIFVTGEGDVAGEAQRNRSSIEETAREMRYRFLFARARDFSADAVAVGHNADDQVETVLMHMLRGSGLNGLRGMAYRTLSAWDTQIPLVRPLLKTWRSEIMDYCNESGLQASLDQSNLEPLYFRNRIRLNLVPGLEEIAPGARGRIWNLSKLTDDDLGLLDDLEQQAWAQTVRECGQDHVIFSLSALRGHPEALVRRLIRRAASLLRPSGEGIDLENTLRAVKLVQSPNRGQTIELADHLVLRVRGEDVILAGREYKPGDSQYPRVSEVGSILIHFNTDVDLGSGWKIRAEECTSPDAEAIRQPRGGLNLEAWLDADTLRDSLSVRPPHPGDRFQPLGMPEGSQKLSDFWINHQIPAVARKTWPLVLEGKEIIWVPGFSPAHRVRITPGTSRCVHLAVFSNKNEP